MFFYKTLITLYKKYLPMTQSQYDHARETCLDSAIKILKYHHLLDEETQLDDRFSSVRWRVSSILNHDFMLAASVLCFYIKLCNTGKNMETCENIRPLLRKSHEIWLRSSNASKEAQKAVQSLDIILGIQHVIEEKEVSGAFSNNQNFLAQFNNPESWPACQGRFISLLSKAIVS